MHCIYGIRTLMRMTVVYGQETPSPQLKLLGAGFTDTCEGDAN